MKCSRGCFNLVRFLILIIPFVWLTLGLKKPAGTAEEIEKQFNCESSRLIMVIELVEYSIYLFSFCAA